MKVYVLPSDAFGCGHYRMIWAANCLQRQGHDITIIPPGSDSGFLVKSAKDDKGEDVAVSVRVPTDADVIVVQRPAHMLQPEAIRIMRNSGIAVVVDMDDDMSSIHPNNAAYHIYRHTSGTPMSWRNAWESCKAATLVTTSTKSLQKVYAPHRRGVVVDNYVPAAYLHFPKTVTNTFGWAGTVKSHPNDPQVTGNTCQKLVDQGHQFKVVGQQYGVRSAFRMREDPPVTGSVGLENWARTIAETIDVGMVPLAPTSFNTSKSRLKGIEMMAVGVAWVASPREEYRKLSKESGVGLLADTPKEWYQKIKLLMEDDALRKEQAEAGKEYMRTQTYEANAWRWIEAWQHALEIQRS
jgi:Glycosyl transferases group 1